MKPIAVVAEFNPFHKGHAYLLERIRQTYGDAVPIVIILSGSFVQRGEPAIVTKWQRTAWALRAGAALVVELPAVYALSHADGFASGAIRLTASLGCGAIACGVETGMAAEFRTLGQAAATLGDLAMNDHSGKPYGQYVSDELRRLYPKESQLLDSPNSLLAMVYAKAIAQYAPYMDFLPIRRQGATHDARDTTGGFASASALRQAIATGQWDTVAPYVPDYVVRDLTDLLRQGAYTDYDRYGDAVVFANRFRTADELHAYPAFTEGLENRWERILQTAPTWPDALEALKTRRYAYSRLCRMGAYTVLGITKDVMDASLTDGPQYARILGLAPAGRPLLKQLKHALDMISISTVGAALGRPNAETLFSKGVPSDAPTKHSDDGRQPHPTVGAALVRPDTEHRYPEGVPSDAPTKHSDSQGQHHSTVGAALGRPDTESLFPKGSPSGTPTTISDDEGRQCHPIPMVTKITDTASLSPLGRRQLAIDCRATDMQSLCQHAPYERRGKKDYVISPHILNRK